jgi:hypothetical protein
MRGNEMGLTGILGIILAVLGLGSGVWSWFLTGLAGPFPAIGLIMFLIGLYLIISDLRKPKTTPTDIVTAGAGLLVSYAAGKIVYDQIQKFFEEKEKEKRLTYEQILALERKVDELYLQGKMPPERYNRSKQLIAQLKQRYSS